MQDLSRWTTTLDEPKSLVSDLSGERENVAGGVPSLKGWDLAFFCFTRSAARRSTGSSKEGRGRGASLEAHFLSR